VAYELAIEMGVDALEPDIVATRDGVLVLRHENEISGTTNVMFESRFADRRTTKLINGVEETGWFTEDFTWAELSTLRAAERLPKIRRGSATFVGGGGILRLSDLLELIDAADRPITLVAEIKHATYFASIGLDLVDLFATEIAGWATQDNLIVESFEEIALTGVRAHGIPGRVVYLIDSVGSAPDLVASLGEAAPTYCDQLTDTSLAQLAARVDGVSLSKELILARDASGSVTGITDIVSRIHAAGLLAFVWTLRAENHFLAPNFRSGVIGRGIGEVSAAAYGRWQDEFLLVMSSGVDGVFADQPDLAVRARELFQPTASTTV
jgi:glycerophosphoryl diester phosphodiesterase